MVTLRSPNEMLAAARAQMLDGREPTTHTDWVLVFNFFATHILAEAQPACLYVMAKIYDVPLSEKEIEDISAFQIAAKAK